MSSTNLPQVLCVKADIPNFFISICCRTDGCYMLINGGNNKIHVYDAGGKLLQSNFGNRFLNRRFSEPSLITELPNGRIAVFDRSSSKIKKLSFSGDHIATFDVGLPTYSLTTNQYGHMVMAHQQSRNSRIATIRNSETGHIIHKIDIPNVPRTISDSPVYAVYNLKNNLVTLDQSSCSLSVHTLDGVVALRTGKQGFGYGDLNNPSSLSLDHMDQLVVADTKNDRIVRYRCDSFKSCQTLLSNIYRPLSVAIDNSGHLVVLTAKYFMLFDYDIERATVPVL